MIKEYKPDNPVSKPLGTPVGSKTSECTMCKEVFTSPTLFDKHLKRVSCKIDKYKMICQNPKDVGMEIGNRGYWTIPQEGEWWGEDD